MVNFLFCLFSFDFFQMLFFLLQKMYNPYIEKSDLQPDAIQPGTFIRMTGGHRMIKRSQKSLKQTLEKILFRNYMYLILTAALLISIFSAVLDASATLSNEKKNMYESLKQAQININKHTQMIEDYLTLTHADSELQREIRELNSHPSTTLLTKINEALFSVDLFKKNLDSMQIFAYEPDSFLPDFTSTSRYSNALFSARSVSSTDWFKNTVKAGGKTYWFVDTKTFQKPTLSAARVLYDVKNPSHLLGVIKANVTIEKLIRHLGSLSFGDKGYALIEADGQLLHPYAEIPGVITQNLPNHRERLAATHLLVEFPVITKGWNVAGIISSLELYQNTFRNLLPITLVFAFALLLAALLSRKSSRRISLPVHSLCQHMQKMEPATDYDMHNCIEVDQLYDTYNGMLVKNNELMKSREETLLKFKQAEMAALQSQMNPHFIYNTLESISALIATDDNEHAALMITGLGKFLRSSLNNGNNFITLEKEIEQVSSYVEIQKLRYANKIELRLCLPSPLPDYRIIKLILQPLVENSIVHGFKDLDEIGVITITVEETKEQLFLSVADNGWGSDIEMLNYLVRRRTLYKEDNVNFYCIQNVYQRLSNCYGNHADLTYEENDDGGVTAVIRIDKQVL